MTGPIGPARASFVQMTTSAESRASAGRPAAVSVAAIVRTPSGSSAAVRGGPRCVTEVRAAVARLIVTTPGSRCSAPTVVVPGTTRSGPITSASRRSLPRPFWTVATQVSSPSAWAIERSASAPANVFVSTITRSTCSSRAGSWIASQRHDRALARGRAEIQPLRGDRLHVLPPGVDERDVVAGEREVASEHGAHRAGSEDRDSSRAGRMQDDGQRRRRAEQQPLTARQRAARLDPGRAAHQLPQRVHHLGPREPRARAVVPAGTERQHVPRVRELPVRVVEEAVGPELRGAPRTSSRRGSPTRSSRSACRREAP